MADHKRILVTGSEGYIGSVLCPYLTGKGHMVTGLDSCWFTGYDLYPASRSPGFSLIRKDLRDLVPADVAGFDAVIHLAAISNDPLGDLAPELTAQINERETLRLAELCKTSGVSRFLFSSSCIMYGMTDDAFVTEKAPLAPETAYARSKVGAERALAELADDSFSPVFLRNGTVYGISPRMRLDTVLNNLVAAAVVHGKVSVWSDGTPWRPVVHVDDLVRSFELFLNAPRAAIHNEAFNNGNDSLNFQVKALAEAAVDAVPGSSLEILGQSGADQRTYRASFAKMERVFPDFKFRWLPPHGAQQLAADFRRYRLQKHDVVENRYVRLQQIARLKATQQINSELRWSSECEVHS